MLAEAAYPGLVQDVSPIKAIPLCPLLHNATLCMLTMQPFACLFRNNIHVFSMGLTLRKACTDPYLFANKVLVYGC